jgi:FlaA1/EpsC-like NDP-sugar epimerase
LVTGAGGSIGSALSLRLAGLGVRKLILLDASEQALFRLDSRIPDSPHVTTILGSVADHALLDEIFSVHRPELIFHAAAFKHVPLLEKHPLAAMANNIGSTQALVQEARRHNDSRVVLLSTDKAVDPSSILGATKRVAEQIVLNEGGVALRLGNVLASDGSVVHAFLQQIRDSGPVTITDPEAERFFLTCEEAVELLLTSAATAMPGALLVPELTRSHRVTALAEFLISLFAEDASISMIRTGIRPGDKVQEALWGSHERRLGEATDGLVSISQDGQSEMQVDARVKRLLTDVHERHLATALSVLQELVPNYTPSETVHAMAQNWVFRR